MNAQPFWIETGGTGRLAILPRPRGGDWLADEVAAWRRAGLDVVVSLLEPEETIELELSAESNRCRAAGLSFLSLAIPDRGVPESGALVSSLIAELEAHLSAGRAIGIHCRFGVGRSGLLAACLLARYGFAPAKAFAVIGRARGRTVPDAPEQARWVEHWAARFARQSLLPSEPEAP